MMGKVDEEEEERLAQMLEDAEDGEVTVGPLSVCACAFAFEDFPVFNSYANLVYILARGAAMAYVPLAPNTHAPGYLCLCTTQGGGAPATGGSVS
jgi:hypothetical protein